MSTAPDALSLQPARDAPRAEPQPQSIRPLRKPAVPPAPRLGTASSVPNLSLAAVARQADEPSATQSPRTGLRLSSRRTGPKRVQRRSPRAPRARPEAAVARGPACFDLSRTDDVEKYENDYFPTEEPTPGPTCFDLTSADAVEDENDFYPETQVVVVRKELPGTIIEVD